MSKVTAAGYIGSASPSDVVETNERWSYKVLDLATDAAWVAGVGPCLLGTIWVDVVMSAHACPFQDGAGNTVFNVPASSAAGLAITNFRNTVFSAGLVVDSNNSGTGTLVIQYRALK